MNQATTEGLERITVEIGDPVRTEAFTGRWLVEPSDNNRGGADNGACWAIAATARGRIAVHMWHVNEMWPAELFDFDTIEEAAASDRVPEEYLSAAASALGQQWAVERDI